VIKHSQPTGHHGCLTDALTEATLSLASIAYPTPLDPPDAHICGVIARSALARILSRMEATEMPVTMGLLMSEMEA
jgi:hypothetical protein